MNCCDEFGNCNQGRDCPVRKIKAWPTVPPDVKPPAEPVWTSMNERMVDAARAVLVVVIWLYAACVIVWFMP